MARLLITGSRTWFDREAIRRELRTVRQWVLAGETITLVHGAARGADTIAAGIWERWGYPTEPYPLTSEDWERDGKAAGHIRNKKMVDSGVDFCLAFRRKKSPGTTQCLEYARSKGVPVRVIEAAR